MHHLIFLRVRQVGAHGQAHDFLCQLCRYGRGALAQVAVGGLLV